METLKELELSKKLYNTNVTTHTNKSLKESGFTKTEIDNLLYRHQLVKSHKDGKSQVYKVGVTVPGSYTVFAIIKELMLESRSAIGIAEIREYCYKHLFILDEHVIHELVQNKRIRYESYAGLDQVRLYV